MANEIELRAPVDEIEFDKLVQRIAALPDYRVQRRCFIDYSTFLEGIGTRVLDVRLRITDSVPEIIVKRGQFGGSIREEAAVDFSLDQLESGLNLMNLLGYSKGVAGGRRIHRGTDNGIELALQEVLDFSQPTHTAARFIEVEAMQSGGDDETAVLGLNKYLADLGLEPFSITDWNSFVEHLNAHYNGVYEHGVTDPGIVRLLG